MRQLIVKIFVFAFIIVLSMYLVFSFVPNGYADGHYQKFTTPQQTSLVLGTSRAAQGICPEILNNILGRNDIYNYAFTIYQSPFGPVYLKAIEKKLDPATRDGVFIISVDPWSLATGNADPYDSANFIENDLALGVIKNVTQKPNIRYLIEFYEFQYYRLFVKAGAVYLHNDGWVEVNVPMDSVSVQQRTDVRINDIFTDQVNKPANYKFSGLRYNYLIKTISFLKKHGDVYLVRLPVHPDYAKAGDMLFPDFGEKMNELQASEKIPYLDLSVRNGEFVYTDGLHLYKESAQVVTKIIGDWIKDQKTTLRSDSIR